MNKFLKYLIFAFMSTQALACEPKNIEEHPDTTPPVETSGPGIATAQDLVDFADAVNSGESIAEWQDEAGAVNLLSDIDMASVTEWTPIGNGQFTGSTSGNDQHRSSYEGPAFSGVFDGKGFSIRNFKLAADLTAESTVYGLFGILDGAVVRNLTIGAAENDASELTFHAEGIMDAGVFAGAVMASTIEDCVNYAPMHVKGNSTDNMRTTMGAFAGFVYADETTGSMLKNLTNYGSVRVEGDVNTKNGATSVMGAGIVGMGNGITGGAERNLLYNCVNYGDMTSSVPRTAGIIAAMNQNTDAELCKNYGHQTNSNRGTRVGMITAIMGLGTAMKDCENHGDAIMTGGTSAQVGGLVCLLNHATVSVTGGGNYGRIIGDIAANSYKGLLVANFSNFEKVENVVAGGSVGAYNGGEYVMEDITSDNYMNYIGKYSAANAAKIVNIIYPGGDDSPGIRTAQDLVDFAAAVNSGVSIERWQDKEGGVNLLANIDMSSVTDWTPIGNAVCPAGGVDPVITGNAWTGKFDGNGRKISGLKLVSDGTEAGMHYGLFGVLAPGSIVQNLIIDSSCSLEVTATASCASGVLAGYVYDATVRDVTSYAPMTFRGKAGNTFMSMALVGQVYCENEGVTMDSCHNYGEIRAENTDNTVANANAYHIAGLVGLANAKNGAPVVNTISDCSNYGSMTSATGRTSGICAACNRNVQLVNCVNHGDQSNTFPVASGGRLGNISCIVTAGCKMTGCSNYGDLVSTTSGCAGGIVCLPNTVEFENCANYGEILTDNKNRGLLWSYNNANVSVWKNCTAGGKVGTYNGGSPVYDEYTEADKVKYLGTVNAGVETSLTDINWMVGTTGPETGSGDAELSILFIGNSFTKDAVEHLPGLLKAAGIDKVQLTHMYYGGRLVSEYYAGWSTRADYKCYECAPGASVWTETTGRTLKQVAESRSWDIITIQEHTGNAVAWKWTPTAQGNLQGLVNNAKATQTGAMPKFYYIMSQAYFNMDKIGSGSKPSMTWTDQAGMWETIAVFGRNVMDNVAFDGIISTGVMLQNLRTSPLDNEMNLTRDGYHMDNGISRYGAACAVFETLITPKFNVKLDGNTYRYNVSNTSTTAYSTPVTDANAPVALQAARYAIESPYVVTDMSDVMEDLPGNSIGDIDYEEGGKE